MIAQPWLAVILGVLLVGAMGGAYVKGRGDGRAVEIASRQQAEAIRMETLQLAQKAAAEAISMIEVKHVTIRQQLETEIREKPVYRECATDQRVLDLTNEAITGDPAAGAGELPSASANVRTNLR